MKLLRKVGATSEIWQVFIADSSSVTGAGLIGLVFNSGSLTCYYHRDTDTTATVVSLVTMTVGTFTSSGFKEIDATNMPGWYQFCPPNAALASGAKSCGFHLKGATNMVPLPIEVDLDGQVDVMHWNGTAVTSPNTAGTPVVDVGRINNIATTAVTTVKAVQGLTTADTISALAANSITAAVIADAAIDRATFAADTGLRTVISGTIQTGSNASFLKFDSGASSVSDFYAGRGIYLTGGTGAGQLSMLLDYDGPTKSSNISPSFTTTPDNTTTYAILPSIFGFMNEFYRENAYVTAQVIGVPEVMLADGVAHGGPTATLELGVASGSQSPLYVHSEADGIPGVTFENTAGSFTNNNVGFLVSSQVNSFGAIFSIFGDITGSLSGSVGSMVGSVGGSVSGNLGGSVLGGVNGNVNGKVLGGGAGVITGTGVRAVDSSGNAIASAASIAALSIPTAVQNADALIARNIKGGSNTGRTVAEALAASRNRVVFTTITATTGTFTVYDTDDTTALWTGTYDRGANTIGPLTGVDPG